MSDAARTLALADALTALNDHEGWAPHDWTAAARVLERELEQRGVKLAAADGDPADDDHDRLLEVLAAPGATAELSREFGEVRMTGRPIMSIVRDALAGPTDDGRPE